MAPLIGKYNSALTICKFRPRLGGKNGMELNE